MEGKGIELKKETEQREKEQEREQEVCQFEIKRQ